MNSQNDTRLEYMDAVRCFALLLGIVFHASLSFMPIFIGWAVMDISTSAVVPNFVLLSHSFRMPLFFLIAGLFAHMSFHKNGGASFLKSRLTRIGIPFVIAWLVCRPLLLSAWFIGGESMRGDADIMSGLKYGLTALQALPRDFLVGTHLWFLYYLLIITASILCLRFFLVSFAPLKQSLSKFTDMALRSLLSSPYLLIIMAVPTSFCLWFMQHWGLDTPDQLQPIISVFCLYAACFSFGWLVHRHLDLFDAIARVSLSSIFLCLLAVAGTLLLSRFETSLGQPYFVYVKAGYMFLYSLMMWSFMLLSIGLCKRYCSSKSRWRSYVTDASYWLYLVHLPIVVFLQIGFAELDFHWLFKLASICFITLAFSLLIYDLCIRSTAVGGLLNGKRKARMLFS